MGYNTTRFVNPVDQNLLCGICSGVLENPVLTPCGHTFCATCLGTWLWRPGTRTCPECRSGVSVPSSKPVLALRNLIQSMLVVCDNSSRGCSEQISLENAKTHIEQCSFQPVECQACGITVNRCDFSTHQSECPASIDDFEETAQSLDSDSSFNVNTSSACRSNGPTSIPSYDNHNDLVSYASFCTDSHIDLTAQVIRLLQRINTLETQVSRLLEDLQDANKKNLALYTKYKEARKLADDLESSIQRVSESDNHRQSRLIDPDHTRPTATYSNGTSPSAFSEELFNEPPEDIRELSVFIALNLMNKPERLDRDEVFGLVKGFYESIFFPSQASSPSMNLDLHRLLATAYACNWFSVTQRVTIGCWLQCVLRFGRYQGIMQC